MELVLNDVKYNVYLVDNGTIDTVLSVNGFEVAFSQEYASDFRNEATGELTPQGFRALAWEAIEDYEDDKEQGIIH